MTRAAANDLLNMVRAGFDVDPHEVGLALVATGDLEHAPQPVIEHVNSLKFPELIP